MHSRFFVISASTIFLHAQQKPWTQQYRFSYPHHSIASKEAVLIVGKEHIPASTQIMCTWNAVRPAQGYYTFYIQVHSVNRNRWSSWHKIADWGACVQKTYESPSDGIGRYIYVRWEAAEDDKADGFRIKVIPHETDFSGLQDLMVTVSDFSAFTPEQIPKGRFSSVVVAGVPKKSQLMLAHEDKQKMCSPVSCSMVMEYLLCKKVDPLAFAQSSYDSGLCVYGSWPINMAHAYELMPEKSLCYVTRLHSFKELHTLLRCNMPVTVSVRGVIANAPQEYTNGHLLVVVGYDAAGHAIICHDPAALTHEDTLKKYDVQDFVQAWERSRRLAYIIMPRTV